MNCLWKITANGEKEKIPQDHTLRIAALIFLPSPKVRLSEFAFLSNVGVTEATLVFYLQRLLEHTRAPRLPGRVARRPLEPARLESSPAPRPAPPSRFAPPATQSPENPEKGGARKKGWYSCGPASLLVGISPSHSPGAELLRT